MQESLPNVIVQTERESGPTGSGVPLIATKIQVPRRQPSLLPRQRLVNLIHTYLDRKLILISAPAGYGKTMLLADFAHDTDLPVCWYTLDPFDQDIRVFVEYLIASIARQFPAFGSRTRAFLHQISDPGSNLYPIVATLVQEIYDTIPEYFVLILDDHHTVENQDQVSELLDLFVTYVDENCRLILASRTLPSLPSLSLLVARRQAAGLSIDELRFTPEEIVSLAQQNHGLNLTLDQAEGLAQRTGGWITGLLLTPGPSWQSAPQDAPLRGRISVDLYDYLTRQVLAAQPPQLRDFLLGSSVLDELSPDLCVAVLGADNVLSLIEQVRARNLFVIEFEDDDLRLRYHDLFREYLHANLRRQDENRYWELTRRAADAYAVRGEWERAVSRYLVLREYGLVAQLVDRTGRMLFDRGRWDTLAGWIDVLPDSVREARPQFLVWRGKIHAERGDYNPALSLLAQAERVYRDTGDVARAALTVATRGSVLRLLGRCREAMACCQHSLSTLHGGTPQEQWAAALATKEIGLCQVNFGQLAVGRDTLQQALRLYEDLRDVANVATVQHDLGLGHERAGDLERATSYYQAALKSWEKLGSPGPWANTLNGLGVVFYVQGRYDEALPILNEALAKARIAGDPRVQAYTLASLGDVYRDLGANERAQASFAQALEVARGARIGFITTYAQDALGNLLRQQGEGGLARQQLLRAMEQAQANDSPYETAMCHTSLGILAGSEGDLVAARRHLDQAIEVYEAIGLPQELARAHLHRAQVAFQAGQAELALTDVEHSLTLAARLGSDQFLVVDGQPLVPLLRYAAKEGVGRDVLPGLLQRIEAHRMRLRARPEPALQVEPPPTLHVHSLGQALVEVNGQAVQWLVTQSRDLFFLLLQHPAGLRKERIGEVFWPEHAPQKLDGIFRSTLYRLRRSIFRDVVLYEGDLYRLNRSQGWWCDAEAFENGLDRAAQSSDAQEQIDLLEAAIVLYRGDYLDGVYADWPVLERERLRGRYLAALETLAGLRAEDRGVVRAVELYQRLLTHDPYREAARRSLMLCYYRLGDRAAAIRQYQACVEILREDLGLSPSAETEEVYLRIIS